MAKQNNSDFISMVNDGILAVTAALNREVGIQARLYPYIMEEDGMMELFARSLWRRNILNEDLVRYKELLTEQTTTA